MPIGRSRSAAIARPRFTPTKGRRLRLAQTRSSIGADGFDDDDNRAAGENIVITRDDGNVVVGGTGDVNAQIGDSEQGAVIMGVTRTFIQGGGAY